MVDTERMKRVLDRLAPRPGPALPPPPLPPAYPGPFPGAGGAHRPETPACPELFRRERELEALFGELSRRSRSLFGLMNRLRTSSRQRQAILRRFCGPEERLPPLPMPSEGGREGVYRMLRRALMMTEDLEKGYRRASGKGELPAWLERSTGETRRTLERPLRRIRR